MDEGKGQFVDTVAATVVSRCGQTRNIMVADGQVPSLLFLVSRTRQRNAPPLQWVSIGVRVGVHATWAIWVAYRGARAEGRGVAGTIPVGIIVMLVTGSRPVGIPQAALARLGGIIEAVLAIVVAFGRGSIVATAVVSGWIIEARIAVVVVTRGIGPMGRTEIASVGRAGGEMNIGGMVVMPPTVRRWPTVSGIATGWHLSFRRMRLFIRWRR
jgi:hypothetical protein